MYACTKDHIFAMIQTFQIISRLSQSSFQIPSWRAMEGAAGTDLFSSERSPGRLVLEQEDG
jgi:hypothetical protein